MAKPKSNRLAEVRKAHGWTQQQLGDAVGAHWITISKLERGKMQMTFTWLEKLSSALSVFPSELLSSEYPSPEVTLDAEIIDAKLRLKEFERVTIKTYVYEHTEESSFWMRCADDSLRPYFREGDLIRFIHIDAHNISDHVGRMAIISDEDMEKSIFGVIELSLSSNLIEVRRFNATTIFDYEPKHVYLASEVKFYLVSKLEPA